MRKLVTISIIEEKKEDEYDKALEIVNEALYTAEKTCVKLMN